LIAIDGTSARQRGSRASRCCKLIVDTLAKGGKPMLDEQRELVREFVIL
jgi:hypothetical protein